MKKSISELFIKSCYSFKDLAKFRFIDIGKTLQYVFLLVFLYFLPNAIKTLVIDKNYTSLLSTFDNGSLFIIIPFYIIAMYILYIGIIFIKISFLAWVAQLIGILCKRTLPYRNSWRLTSFCITLPTLIFGIIPLFNIDIPNGLFFDLLACLLFIFGSIINIPKRKKS